MTIEQAMVFALLGAMLVAFALDRVRYDLVALATLLIAVAVGLVAPKDAFSGFGDDIVIIVGSALVVSAGVARSGLAETLMRRLVPGMRSTELQIAVLAGMVALLSAFMKNIGALAIFIPVAVQLSRRNGLPPSRLLMPLSFAALLGGLMTLIGTSPNIIVSGVREEMLGEPFSMFDFTPVGLALSVLGIAFLAFGWRLLPRTRAGAAPAEELFSVEAYHAEVRVPPASPFVGKTVRELEDLGEGDVTVAAIVREQHRRYEPSGHWILFAGDVLVLQCDAHALARIVADAGLDLLHDKWIDEGESKGAEVAIAEAVVGPTSILIGRTAENLRLRDRFGVNLLALSRHGANITERLRRVRIRAGDLVVLRLLETEMAERLAQLGCLPLAERRVRIGEAPNRALAPTILALAMVAAASGAVTVGVAFFGAAVLTVALRAITMREAYEAVEWPILVLLGALIPVSEALRSTGASELIAAGLSEVTLGLPPLVSVGLVMLAAMAVTPFLNNAATVLMVAPIGASLATRLGLSPDPFLMAVAVGAACDFLTPIGHQCNTLVMGPGGYRFGDYWKLGLPLSLLVLVVGTMLIVTVWPLR
jgi:di/tricarboxylate transporter